MFTSIRGVAILSILIAIKSDLVHGQAYPSKPIRIVTSGLGGGSDFVARLVAQGITGSLGQQVVVENRASNILGELMVKAPADGYNLIVIGTAFWIAPFLQKASYDPVRDFSPITLTDRAPSVLVVHPSIPVRSVKELITLAKSKPGALNYGAGSPGSAAHLAMELFKSMAGVNIVNVHYKNFGTAITDLLTGELQTMMSTAASVAPHINSGRVKALAIATTKPSTLLPNLPTIAASGLPNYEAVSITGVFAPAKTPGSIISLLNREIVRYVSTEDVKAQLLKTGSEAVGSSPEELANAIKSDMAKFGKLIKDSNIRSE